MSRPEEHVVANADGTTTLATDFMHGQRLGDRLAQARAELSSSRCPLHPFGCPGGARCARVPATVKAAG